MSERKMFHYCCKHSQRKIGRYGTLVPYPQVFGGKLVWLTDMDSPDAEGLGLTSHIHPCDRLACRYVVRSDAPIVPWLASVHRAAFEHNFGADAVAEFEDGRMPEHWFVCASSVAATEDRSWAR